MVSSILAAYGCILIILALCIALEFDKITKKEAVMFPKMELKILFLTGAAFIGIGIIGGIGVLIIRIFF